MKLVLLITIIFTLSLVHGFNYKPCQKNNKIYNMYNSFRKKHIIQESFNRSSVSEWETYINNGGCCRGGTQSFLESSDQDNIEKICNGEGHPLKNRQSDLCISDSTFKVYDLKVDITNNLTCKVMNPAIQPIIKKVIVACNVISNKCVPVHFQKLQGQEPDNDKVCKP